MCAPAEGKKTSMKQTYNMHYLYAVYLPTLFINVDYIASIKMVTDEWRIGRLWKENAVAYF
jgi:hypothetical protein